MADLRWLVRGGLGVLLGMTLPSGCGLQSLDGIDEAEESDDCHLYHDTTRSPSLAACAQRGAYAPLAPGFNRTIDGYATYVGQTTCDNKEKPGVAAFRAFVNQTYPCTGNLGVSRACNLGGKSEHKEGRAWDWAVNATHPSAQALTDWLLATDEYGNRHAMARRLGIMYMVWNRKIWRSYQASKGWQRYTGANPHTDHIHFSFSWAAARKRSTFWVGSEKPNGSYGDCFYGGARGTCQEQSLACPGGYRGSLCPGPATIKCCMPEAAEPPPPPANPWGSCSYQGNAGTCQETTSSCGGYYRAKLCPGPNSVQCCLEGTAWGRCTSGAKSGWCQETSKSCGGSYQAGLCPGPNSVRCCLP